MICKVWSVGVSPAEAYICLHWQLIHSAWGSSTDKLNNISSSNISCHTIFKILLETIKRKASVTQHMILSCLLMQHNQRLCYFILCSLLPWSVELIFHIFTSAAYSVSTSRTVDSENCHIWCHIWAAVFFVFQDRKVIIKTMKTYMVFVTVSSQSCSVHSVSNTYTYNNAHIPLFLFC